MEEERQGEQGSEETIGTTGRGIGPCYQDKVGRLWQRPRRRDALSRTFPPAAAHHRAAQEPAAANLHRRHAKQFDADALCDEYLGYAEQMKPFIRDTTRLLHQALKAGKRMIFEAAQGSLLDVDHGTYPYVTSSNSSTTGHLERQRRAGAASCRASSASSRPTPRRVGRGPFPTELDDGPQGIGERIRKAGKEYGTVTGRPRRCGWFDAVAVRHSAALGDADALALMLLDVLSGLDELKICTAYELDGRAYRLLPRRRLPAGKMPAHLRDDAGLEERLDRRRKLTDLPAAARRYVDRICALVELPAAFVSVGPDCLQTIMGQ